MRVKIINHKHIWDVNSWLASREAEGATPEAKEYFTNLVADRPSKKYTPSWICVEVPSLEAAMSMDCAGMVTVEEFATQACLDELGITLTEYGASMKLSWCHVEFVIMPDDTPIEMKPQPLH